MKKIMILVSCLTLSACGGDISWLGNLWNVPENTTPATQPSMDEVIAINQNVTMLSTQLDDGTDISDVTFINNAYEGYSFSLDSDKRIEGFVRNYDGKHYTRDSNSNVFIDDEKDYRYAFESFDENHVLSYSDFGLFDYEDDFGNDMLFVGGYNSKRIDSPTDLYDGSDPLFVGSAVARIERSHTGGIIAKTNDASLAFGTTSYKLSMPFHSQGAGGDDYYNVTYHSDGNKLVFDGGYTGDYKWKEDTGSGVSMPVGMGSGPIAYGDNGVTKEIVGFVGVSGTDQYDSSVTFEAVYGLTKTNNK